MKKLPWIVRWALALANRSRNREIILGDFEEIYNEIFSIDGRFRAILWCFSQILRSVPRFFITTCYWSVIMFRSYLKIAFRNLLRHKGYSSINIFGLSAGIACCLFVMLFVRHELSFDKYHENAERIFRVCLSQETNDGKNITASNMTPLAPTLKENFPQVENAARIGFMGVKAIKYENRMFYEDRMTYANSGLFKVFNIVFLQGDSETALDRPKTAVISEDIAEKYFGDEDPLGKSIQVNSEDFEITGVLENPPSNTHLQYTIIGSWKSVEDHEYLRDWHPLIAMAITYIKLAPGVDIAAFEDQIGRIAHNYIGEQLEEMGAEFINFLQPVTDIHLQPDPEDKNSGGLLYIYLFSAVGILILLIACINFMNLSTARSANRAGEVGMRKVMGARRKQLVAQFLGESIFMSLFAFFAAVLIVILLMPYFNNIAGTDFSISSLFAADMTLYMLGLIIVVGILAGSYPALFLSAFRPVAVIKGRLRAGTGGKLMRKTLVVGQFAISITLIIGTLIVYRQLNYMKNQPLGFDREQKLVLYLSSWDIIEDSHETVKSEFMQHPSITAASASSGVPGRGINRLYLVPENDSNNKGQAPRILRCDYDFLSVYKIQMAAGRPFQKEMGTDGFDSGFLINQSAVKSLGWTSPEEAVGKRLLIGNSGNPYEIIGVTKDFHWKGLQNPVEPQVFRFAPMFRYLTLQLDTQNISETLSFVENKYSELFPDDIFDYFFLDPDFDRQYRFEEKVGRISSILTLLGVIISCLGLFGLASFIAEQRTKEIGIRKVLGSSISSIIILLSKEFVKLVFLGTIIGWPIAYYAVDKWLQNFAYRTDPGWITFLLAALTALLIAGITVSYQAYKAAAANPVDSLRYE